MLSTGAGGWVGCLCRGPAFVHGRTTGGQTVPQTHVLGRRLWGTSDVSRSPREKPLTVPFTDDNTVTFEGKRRRSIRDPEPNSFSIREDTASKTGGGDSKRGVCCSRRNVRHTETASLGEAAVSKQAAVASVHSARVNGLSEHGTGQHEDTEVVTWVQSTPSTHELFALRRT